MVILQIDHLLLPSKTFLTGSNNALPLLLSYFCHGDGTLERLEQENCVVVSCFVVDLLSTFCPKEVEVIT